MCPRAIWKFDNKDISFDLLRKIIDDGAQNFELVNLTGAGEPFMNPKLFDMVRYIKSKGIYTRFATNATLFNKDNIKQMFAAGLDDIMLAFDGATANVYEKYRRGARFESTRENILLFLKRKNQLNAPISVTLQMIRLPGNEHQIVDFLKMWDIKGVNHIRIKEDEIRIEGVCLRKKETRRSKRPPCFYLWQDPPFIQENGDVYPCCHMWRSEPLGNVRDMSLARLWNNQRMQDLRIAHGSGHQPADCLACRAPVPRLPLIIGSFLVNTYQVRRIIPMVEKAALFYNIPLFRK